MQADPIRDALYEASEDPIAHAQARLWLVNGLIVVGLILAVTNASSVERWAAAQDPNWGTETVRLTAGVFSDRLSMVGLDQPKLWLRDGWDGLKALEWSDLDPRALMPAQEPNPVETEDET